MFAAEPTAGTDTNTAAAVASNTNFSYVSSNEMLIRYQYTQHLYNGL